MRLGVTPSTHFEDALKSEEPLRGVPTWQDVVDEHNSSRRNHCPPWESDFANYDWLRDCRNVSWPPG